MVEAGGWQLFQSHTAWKLPRGLPHCGPGSTNLSPDLGREFTVSCLQLRTQREWILKQNIQTHQQHPGADVTGHHAPGH